MNILIFFYCFQDTFLFSMISSLLLPQKPKYTKKTNQITRLLLLKIRVRYLLICRLTKVHRSRHLSHEMTGWDRRGVKQTVVAKLDYLIGLHGCPGSIDRIVRWTEGQWSVEKKTARERNRGKRERERERKKKEGWWYEGGTRDRVRCETIEKTMYDVYYRIYTYTSNLY